MYLKRVRVVFYKCLSLCTGFACVTGFVRVTGFVHVTAPRAGHLNSSLSVYLLMISYLMQADVQVWLFLNIVRVERDRRREEPG